ncbi:hypothetical protein LAD74_00695 [Mycoplasma sp. U97]|uniref:hypothetical protein n=2 Tax=Mycoplasma tauri TaxID=547987 RepID=UPI001CBB8E9E|nr:hypothetical protein [Mycoplasma tauri]MBZ4212517.1 hypothetical protein [Mycoplasma tauri]
MMWTKLNGFLNHTHEIPAIGGMQHILYICTAITLVLFMIFAFNRANRKSIRGAIIFTWVFIFLNEIIFNQFAEISRVQTTEGAAYNAKYLPVQISSLLLWILPFYFCIPNKKWEKFMLPTIGISSVTIGGTILAYPAFVFTEYLANNAYFIIQAVFTFSLGMYIILKGILDPRKWETYLWHMLFISGIIIISIILNEIVYHSNASENIKENLNFMYISHRTEVFPYFADLIKLNSSIADVKTNLIIFVFLFVFGIVFVSILIYLVFFFMFRPFVKEIDDRIFENKIASEKRRTIAS